MGVYELFQKLKTDKAFMAKYNDWGDLGYWSCHAENVEYAIADEIDEVIQISRASQLSDEEETRTADESDYKGLERCAVDLRCMMINQFHREQALKECTKTSKKL